MGWSWYFRFGRYVLTAVSVVISCITIILVLGDIAAQADNVVLKNVAGLAMFCMAPMSIAFMIWFFIKLGHQAYAELTVRSDDI